MAKATGDPAELDAAKAVYDQFASNLNYNRHVDIVDISICFYFHFLKTALLFSLSLSQQCLDQLGRQDSCLCDDDV